MSAGDDRPPGRPPGEPSGGSPGEPPGRPPEEPSGGSPGARPPEARRPDDEPRGADVAGVSGEGPGGEDVLTRRGERIERVAAGCFGVSLVAALALAAVYWEGGQPQAEGVLLAVVLGGIGAGIVVWAKHFMPGGEVSEPREPMASTEEEVADFVHDFEAGESSLRSRRVLVAMGGGACAALGVALLFPIRSLGPRPGKDLKRTAFAAGGLRVVRESGTPVRPEDLPAGNILTVWPEGHTDAADSPTLLIHLRDDQDFRPRSGRDGWGVPAEDGMIVGFSKICTHTGCPVGLYQSQLAQLLCPCHQSTFDVLESCKPIFGPAARSLPQLPLDLDQEGYIVATGDFSDPIGPGFWDRGR